MPRTLSTDRDARLSRGDAMWRELQSAIDAHLEQPLGPSTDWTGHDVYAHFARWQAMTVTNLRHALAGRRPEPVEEEDDALNNRWREEDRALSTDEVRERCARSRQELRDMLAGMAAEQWDAWGHLFAPDIDGQHYEHHLAAVGTEQP